MISWHRYYDPETGRYISADPIGLSGGVNLYVYVNGNPLNFIDPSGENPLLLGVVAISAYYLLTNSDTANAPSSPCEQTYNSSGAEKILGEGLLDIAAVGILSKIFKFAPKSAFNIAKQGGKHKGFLKNNLNRTTDELQKGVTKLEKRIAQHQDKIANPSKHIKDWDKLDPRQQQALINKKWPSDIQRQMEQRDILQGIIKDRN